MPPRSDVSLPFGAPLLVAERAAARGRAPLLTRLRFALARRGVAHRAVVAQRHGELGALARSALEQGTRFVVAVGDDATVHALVNALVDAGDGATADGMVLGIVPAAGCDLARTFGLDRAPERLVEHLTGDAVYPIDVGRARVRARSGEERTRLFVNAAEIGYGAEVTRRAARAPRLLGRVGRLVAMLGAVRASEPVSATVSVDHTSVTEPLTNVVVANGQFLGTGMKVAPRALPDDGLFNVQVWRTHAADIVRMTPRLRLGEHLPDATIREWQSATVRVEADRPLAVQGDGQVLGTTPAALDLLPRALRLKV